MDNFFYSDDFYSDLGELMDALDLEEEDIPLLPDDYSLDCQESKKEKLVTLSNSWISERIDEERFPEDGDWVFDKVDKALSQIDYEKVNSMMPELYYESRVKFRITKQDLLNYIK